MKIEKVNIHITVAPPAGPSLLQKAMIAAIMKSAASANDPAGAESTHEPAPAKTTPTLTPPAIGAPWPGQGGIYAGLCRGEDGAPDYHLILAETAPTEGRKWNDAVAWARTVTVDGHNDFELPSRFESALLYANVRDKLDTNYWHWTDTQYSEGGAWCQYFGYGDQGSSGKSYEGRARAVRRLKA